MHKLQLPEALILLICHFEECGRDGQKALSRNASLLAKVVRGEDLPRFMIILALAGRLER